MSDMLLQNNLMSYLVANKPSNFLTGHWLKTLRDHELDALTELASKAEAGNQNDLDELVALGVTLIAAELRKQKISFDPILIYGVGRLASLEKFSRRKMILIKKPLSLTQDHLDLEVTTAGLECYNQIMDGKTFH